MLITADQLIAHAIGDYILQSDWMATEKVKKSFAAIVHSITYAIPFLFLTRSALSLAIIITTHFMIDRWRLAKYVCYAKNFIAPRSSITEKAFSTPNHPNQIGFHKDAVAELWWKPWSECKMTGYHDSRPFWMTVWLLIIADNTIHILCNGIALKYF